MRTIIADLVRSIHPHDALEQTHIDTTLAWIESGAPLHRIAKPATPPMHLVAYVVLYDSTQRKLLLGDHKKAGLWLPSGGHVEPYEHPQTAAQRELYEELGTEAHFCYTKPLFLTVTQTAGQTVQHTDVSLWYVARGDSTKSLWFDPGEFCNIAWFGLDTLPLQRCDPHLERFAAKLGSSPVL